MKLTQRGFTLVELMIVIAIIGVLTVALYPSINNYIGRGRDAARASHLKDITTSIGTYFTDFERYPTPTSSGCLNSGSLNSTFLPSFPKDPVSTNDNGCGSNGNYGYATGTGYGSNPQYLATASFENEWGGNLNDGGQTRLNVLIGTGVFYLSGRVLLDTSGTVRKGNGSGYVMYK